VNPYLQMLLARPQAQGSLLGQGSNLGPQQMGGAMGAGMMEMSPYTQMFHSVLKSMQGMPSRRMRSSAQGVDLFEQWLQEPQYQRSPAPQGQLASSFTGGGAAGGAL
jgi:hypothetical protein